MAEDLHGVVANGAHIPELHPLEQQQQMPDAGLVHFDAQKIGFRLGRGEFGQGLAVTEADLQDAWRAPAEYLLEIEALG